MFSWSAPLQSVFSWVLWWFGFRQTQKKLLFLGIENAGKTTLMGKLKSGRIVQAAPTWHALYQFLLYWKIVNPNEAKKIVHRCCSGLAVSCIDAKKDCNLVVAKEAILVIGVWGGENRYFMYYSDSERMTLNGNEFVAFDIGGHAQAIRTWKDYYPAVDAIVFIIDTSDPEKLPLAKEELNGLLMNEDIVDCTIAVLGNKIDRRGALSEQQLEQYLELATCRTGKQKRSVGVDGDRRPLEIFMCSIIAGQGYGEAFRWINMQLS